MTSRLAVVALCGLLLAACGGGTDSTAEDETSGDASTAAEPRTPMASAQFDTVLAATSAMEKAMLATVPAQDACEAGVDPACLTALTAAVDTSTAALNTWTSTSQTAVEAATGACRESLDSLHDDAEGLHRRRPYELGESGGGRRRVDGFA
jgi:hypothetical protein